VALLVPLFHAIEARDPFTRGHSSRVTALAECIALRLGWSESQLGVLRLGGRLHDVGKIGVARHILRKPGPLDPEERRQMEAHPGLGARLAASITSVAHAAPSILCHHERWDGCGYPHGRSRNEIPIEARIVAVADAFDAMTSLRPYRRPFSEARALVEIAECAGSQFDPMVAEAFVEVFEAGVISGRVRSAGVVSS
jgi:HD-GYP domain-containing protein (c-di-GMP phosphodiesterase class II)